MSKRQSLLFVAVIVAWTVAIAVLGVTNVPRGLIAYAFDHLQWFLFQAAVLWVLVPLAFVLVFALLLLREIPRVRDFLHRLTYGGRGVPPDREAWASRVLVVASLFTAVGQTWQTVAMVLYWHRHQLSWVADAVRGPHVWGLPDPHQLILRGWLVIAGVVFARFGNRLPKLVTPFRGGSEPYDWSKMIRTCGWVITLGGLGGAACSMLIPDLPTAVVAGGTIIVGSLTAAVPIWAVYRLSGNQSGVAPRS